MLTKFQKNELSVAWALDPLVWLTRLANRHIGNRHNFFFTIVNIINCLYRNSTVLSPNASRVRVVNYNNNSRDYIIKQVRNYCNAISPHRFIAHRGIEVGELLQDSVIQLLIMSNYPIMYQVETGILFIIHQSSNHHNHQTIFISSLQTLYKV